MIHEVRIAGSRDECKSGSLFCDIQKTLGIQSVEKIKIIKLFRFEGLNLDEIESIAKHVLVDSVNDNFIFNKDYETDANYIVEVGLKRGVMNPEIGSISKIIKNLGINSCVAIDTSFEYHFFGEISKDELDSIVNKLLINKTISEKITIKPATLIIDEISPDIVTIPIRSMSIEQLSSFAKSNQLFLKNLELETIQQYFIDQKKDPTDAELETIAQTWSEHCSHKTFKANLLVDGVEKSSLISRLIKTASKFNSGIISAFSDNAGVFNFYDGYGIAAKVETHNSPSAIEPYGGAATGSGGVFRDIMGTGLGAKVIASTDIFCFAPPDIAPGEIPPGCLHSNYLLRHVVAGVRDYGNRMGIPTNNGSVHFHPDFRAKPTVIVGAYGLIPIEKSQKGTPQIGDRILVVGGATGRDGIHGATFSSGSMTSETIKVNSTAVQIGNPIEQKRMADALLVARDLNLIKAITDCGAGGFSSAIGEMGEKIGVKVDLSKVPLKYTGLAPWEIWISESQERMICAVESNKVDLFLQVCADYNVSAVDIGYFSCDARLNVTYEDKIVCDIDMNFLHNGNPKLTLVATSPKVDFETINSDESKGIKTEQEWIGLYKSVMSHWNICSKEPIVRQYDHMVQGMNVLPPYSGFSFSAPQDASVMTPIYGKPYGLIISHGVNPILNKIDPYKGSVWAIVEAISNLVAVGGNPAEVAMIDNFIWPTLDEESLWALDQSMDGCTYAMETFQIPFISGKDSLSSTYNYPNGDILKIPPVICISTIGKVADVSKTISSDFKKVDSLIILIGELDLNSMGGSVYSEVSDDKARTETVPFNDLSKTKNIFTKLHKLISEQIILSCHDVSEGGIATTIAEMCFGGNIGANLDLENLINSYKSKIEHILFNETSGCFAVEIAQEDYEKIKLIGIPHQIIGKTKSELSILVNQKNQKIFEIELQELFAAFKKPMEEIFKQ